MPDHCDAPFFQSRCFQQCLQIPDRYSVVLNICRSTVEDRRSRSISQTYKFGFLFLAASRLKRAHPASIQQANQHFVAMQGA
eukprot:11732111-Alexandrium_andersonii.AAC.1